MRTNIQTVQKTPIPVTISASGGNKRSTLSIKKMNNLPEITRDQEIRLNMPAHMSMVMIIEGKGTSTDWWNVSFRVCTAYEIAKKEYSQQTVDEFKKAVDAILPLFDNSSTGKVLNFEKKNIGVVSEALLAADEIQKHASRPTLVYATKKARATLAIYVRRAVN